MGCLMVEFSKGGAAVWLPWLWKGGLAAGGDRTGWRGWHSRDAIRQQQQQQKTRCCCPKFGEGMRLCYGGGDRRGGGNARATTGGW